MQFFLSIVIELITVDFVGRVIITASVIPIALYSHARDRYHSRRRKN